MWRRTSRSRGESWSSWGSSLALGQAAGERVEHEARQARGEDRVAVGDAAHGVGQLVAGDRLRHVAARAGADDGDDVLRRVAHRQREEALGGAADGHLADHLDAAAARHLHVEQHHVGLGVEHEPHRVVDRRRVAEHVDEAVELGAHAGPEQVVVVDDDDGGHRSSTSSISVPPPGAVCTAARPPWRSIRPTIDSRTPRRSSGTVAGSKPGPRSRTKTSIRPGATSA